MKVIKKNAILPTNKNVLVNKDTEKMQNSEKTVGIKILPN